MHTLNAAAIFAFGALAGAATGYVTAAARIDGIQRGGIQMTAAIPTSAVLNSWEGVKLVKMCQNHSNIYLLPDGTYRTAPRRNVEFGSIVADPEKVC